MELSTDIPVADQILALSGFLEENQKSLHIVEDEIDRFYNNADEGINEDLEDSLWKKQSYIECCIRLAKHKLSELEVDFTPQIISNRILNTVNDYCVVDLETTGLSRVYDQIIEISAIRVRNNEITNTFTQLIQPTIPIPARATKKNGITNEMVKNAPAISEVISKFLEFVGDDILIGHNIGNFDLEFIERECKIILGQSFTNAYIDTLILARQTFDMYSYELSSLCRELGITQSQHRAESDCVSTKELYDKIKQKICSDKYVANAQTNNQNSTSDSSPLISSLYSADVPHSIEASQKTNQISDKKLAMISPLIILGILVITLIIGISTYISTINHNKAVQNELLKHNYTTDFAFIDTPKMTYEYSANKNGYRYIIDGIIQNISGYPVIAVKVLFNFYDINGEFLGKAYDYIGDLDNQSSKKFKAISTEYYQNKAHKANIANVEYSLIIE